MSTRRTPCSREQYDCAPLRGRLRARLLRLPVPRGSAVPREYSAEYSVQYSAEYSRVQTDRARLLVRDAYAKALSDDVDVAKLRAWRAAQVHTHTYMYLYVSLYIYIIYRYI